MQEPLVRRREALDEVCKKFAEPEIVFSPAVIGTGTVFYQEVVVAGHEGVLAKQLRSV